MLSVLEEFGEELKFIRMESGRTQSYIKDLLGFKSIYSYQRLESGKCNPTLSTLLKIKKIFPRLSIDELIEKVNDG